MNYLNVYFFKTIAVKLALMMLFSMIEKTHFLIFLSNQKGYSVLSNW